MFKNIAHMDTRLEKDYGIEDILEYDCLQNETICEGKEKNFSKFLGKLCLFSLILGLLSTAGYTKLTSISMSEGFFSDIFSENILNEVMPETGAISATSVKYEVISAPRKIIKADPFMPSRDTSAKYNTPPNFELIEPPETTSELSEAGRLMDTSVSGILYDSYSPSAILNIEGMDQLVKKGDVISNYEILEIEKDSVTVKLGSNIYRAGIGEMLTSGQINHNKVSNLDTKFGGKNGND